jgi:hypothetical protein
MVAGHRDLDVADAEDVPRREQGAVGLLAVHGDAVGGSGVADDQSAGGRLHHGVAPRRLGVVQHEVAGGIPAHDGDRAVHHDLVHGAARIADHELHSEQRSKGGKTARL